MVRQFIKLDVLNPQNEPLPPVMVLAKVDKHEEKTNSMQCIEKSNEIVMW